MSKESFRAYGVLPRIQDLEKTSDIGVPSHAQQSHTPSVFYKVHLITGDAQHGVICALCHKRVLSMPYSIYDSFYPLGTELDNSRDILCPDFDDLTKGPKCAPLNGRKGQTSKGI